MAERFADNDALRAYEQKRTAQDLAARIAQAEASGVDWTKSLSDQDLVNVFGDPGTSAGNLTTFGQARSARDPRRSSGQVVEQPDGTILLTNVGSTAPPPRKAMPPTPSASVRTAPAKATTPSTARPALSSPTSPGESPVSPAERGAPVTVTATPKATPSVRYTPSPRRKRTPYQAGASAQEGFAENAGEVLIDAALSGPAEAIYKVATGVTPSVKEALDVVLPPGGLQFVEGVQSIYETDQSKRVDQSLRYSAQATGYAFDALQPSTSKQLSPEQLKGLYDDGVITEAAYKAASGGQ